MRDPLREGIGQYLSHSQTLPSPGRGISLMLFLRSLDLFDQTYDTPYRLRVVASTTVDQDVLTALTEWFAHNALTNPVRTSRWETRYFDVFMTENVYFSFKMRWL